MMSWRGLGDSVTSVFTSASLEQRAFHILSTLTHQSTKFWPALWEKCVLTFFFPKHLYGCSQPRGSTKASNRGTSLMTQWVRGRQPRYPGSVPGLGTTLRLNNTTLRGYRARLVRNAERRAPRGRRPGGHAGRGGPCPALVSCSHAQTREG